MFFSKDYQEDRAKQWVNFAESYRAELELLLLKSEGSVLSGFKERIIDDFTFTGVKYLDLMKEKYPDVNTTISRFFIHISSAWWVNVLEEIVVHNLQKEELEQFIKEYVTYSTAGWERLMQIEKIPTIGD